MSLRSGRRTLLQGLGAGTVLLAPFVRRLTAQAQGAAQGNLIVFYTPNGFLRANFGADGPSNAFTLRSSSVALEPHKTDIAIFQNINNMCYPGTERSHYCINRVLTCKAGTDPTVAAGPSFDHFIAGKLSGTPLVLGVEPQRADFTWHRQLSWAAAGNAVRPQLDSKALFGQLFPPTPGDGGDAVAAAKKNRRNKSILDALRGDISTLQGRLDASGKSKLDLHLTTLRELEQSIHVDETATMMCETDMLENGVNTPLARPAASVPRTSKAYTPLLETHGKLQCDLAASAIACGRKRVATIIWQECSWEGVNVEGANANEGHHKVSHYANETITGDGAAQVRACDAFYTRQYAYLLGKLKSLGILDTTIVLWVTEIREGHDQGEFTWITGGGKDLGLTLGRYHNFPYYGPHNDPRTDARNRTTSDLLVSTQKALGIASESFGDPEWCHGGLSEYFAG